MNIEFTTQELNYILAVLAKRPYDEAVNLINKISEQVKQAKESEEAEG